MFINYLIAGIFGLIQGITEFLPISSTGHLILFHQFFKLPVKNELIFDVVLHLATFLAVFWFFRNDVFNLLKAWFRSFSGKVDEWGRLSWLIILGTVPAVLAGYFFEDIIEKFLRSGALVAAMLILVGALFILAEKISFKKDDIIRLNWKKVLFVGFAQAIALIPGTSRSGITIIAGLSVGLKREAAARFSFLLSLPVIFGAVIKKVPQIFGTNLTMDEAGIILFSFIISFLSGFFVIKYFLKFLKNHSLNLFAFYRFILAIIIIILMAKNY